MKALFQREKIVRAPIFRFTCRVQHLVLEAPPSVDPARDIERNRLAVSRRQADDCRTFQTHRHLTRNETTNTSYTRDPATTTRTIVCVLLGANGAVQSMTPKTECAEGVPPDTIGETSSTAKAITDNSLLPRHQRPEIMTDVPAHLTFNLEHKNCCLVNVFHFFFLSSTSRR